MKHKVILKVAYQFDPITLIVDAFKWEENGDLILYDKLKYYRFPYSVLQSVYMEVKPEQRYYAEKFNYKCPYNGEECHSWNCTNCGVEIEEIEYMNMLDEEVENARP